MFYVRSVVRMLRLQLDRRHSKWRQMDVAAEASDRQAIDKYVMATFPVCAYAGSSYFKPAESSSAFTLFGIGRVG